MCSWAVFPAPLGEETIFFPMYIFASFVQNKMSIGEWIYLWTLFCFTDLQFCLCNSTILSWWLQLCSIVWSKEGWFLQCHSFFSSLFWLLVADCCGFSGRCGWPLIQLVTTSSLYGGHWLWISGGLDAGLIHWWTEPWWVVGGLQGYGTFFICLADELF